MNSTRRPLKDELRATASELGVPLDVIEKDYALGHVLTSIYGDDELASCLVFKGGTALRKAYFSDYRFSVDLDFTGIGGPRGSDLEAAVARIAAGAQQASLERGSFRVASARRNESEPHPGAQEAFQVRVQYPWHSQPLCSIKLEMTTDESVLLPTICRNLLDSAEDRSDTMLVCYALEEIVAEKLRTPLQAFRRAVEGKWVRNCARDYYDLWYLTSPDVALDLETVGSILREKCEARDVSFGHVGSFFPATVVAEAERQWRSSLADLVRRLPTFEIVVAELKPRIAAVLQSIDGASGASYPQGGDSPGAEKA